MSPRELMLIGGPNSGKTHFAGQLYARLRRRPGMLQLRQDDGTPANLEPLEEVLRCLECGNAAEHTASGTWAEVVLPIVDAKGREFDLGWPDYAGEQLLAAFRERSVSETWKSRLAASDGWLLVIRLQSESTYRDALAELNKREHDHSVLAKRTESWDSNARWVETLQLLLHASGVGVVRRVRRPRLAVLLSCYDEVVTNGDEPEKVLADRLPLVASFLRSAWRTSDLSVWGLSALGRQLDPKSGDERFVDSGPEWQGWIVPPEGGTRDDDLTQPLAWLVDGR